MRVQSLPQFLSSPRHKTMTKPLPNLTNLDTDQLQDLLKELHHKACLLFGEAFDAQQKVKVRILLREFFTNIFQFLFII